MTPSSARIGLDARMIGASGIGTTIRGLVENWPADRRDRVTLLGGEPGLAPQGYRRLPAPWPVYSLSQHWAYGRFLNRQGFSLYHMPHFDVPMGYGGPLVVTIHDLIHLKFPEHSTRAGARLYAGWAIARAVRRAARIITVSDNTRRDLLALHPEAGGKTVVIHPAADARFQPVGDGAAHAVLARRGLAAGYILYVGNIRGSKNVRRLVEAHARLDGAPELLLVGRNTDPLFLRDGFPARVRHLGDVGPDELPALYTAAGVFAFPSLYEGFGLPPLEAMACGAPVVASNRASLPEVCGDAAKFVDPESVESIRSGLAAVLGDAALRDGMRRRGLENARRFSWRRWADETWKVYESVLGGAA